jgi:plasmid replication initiation protein
MTVRPLPVDASQVVPRLHPDDVEAIARRVAELLRGDTEKPAARLVDAATLARMLGVERDWVYAHARDLQAVRLGGERGRLRFDVAAVFRSLDLQPPTPAGRHPAVRSLDMGGELLPIDP